tara:strand:+ start:842 stop:2302 length:1461 start_codon:yes stop_codon:yes gene_type:complete
MAALDDNDNIINYAGDFRLKACTIISYRKAGNSEKAIRQNILPQVMSVSLVEDITMPVLTGTVDVNDGVDFRTTLPITGMEKLELHVFTPGQDEIKFLEGVTDTFNVYKIEKIRGATSMSSRESLYRIHFVSRESYRNSTTRISKAFVGPVENAVYQICQDEKYLDSRKRVYAEPTATNSKYVIPNLKPFKTIKFLCDNAVSDKYNNAGYLFYETTKGFNFRSFESLMAQGGNIARPSVEKYAMQPANLRDAKMDKDILLDLQSPDSYSFEDVVNTLNELNNGLYANHLVTHDIYNKKISTFNYDYHESYGDHFHTEHQDGNKTPDKYNKPLAYYEDTGKMLSDFPMAKLMSVVDTKAVHNDYEFTAPEVLLPNRVSQRAQMANNHLLLSVPGQTRMNAGTIITFNLPMQQPVPHDEAQKTNPYYSGRYLIISLKHKFDIPKQKHTMNLRTVKDAVMTDLPKGLDEVTVLTDKKDAVNLYEEDERI